MHGLLNRGNSIMPHDFKKNKKLKKELFKKMERDFICPSVCLSLVYFSFFNMFGTFSCLVVGWLAGCQADCLFGGLIDL